MNPLGIEVGLDAPFEEAIQRVTSALNDEGFGVLTSIDVQSTLREKLGVTFRRYTILGACNPSLAHRALQAEPQVGLLLPCNVTVEEIDVQRSRVRMIRPEALLQPLGDLPEIREIADEASAKLHRVAEALRHPAGA